MSPLRSLKALLRELTPLGLLRLRGWTCVQESLAYDEDGLLTIHTPGFLGDPGFESAYRAGCAAQGEDLRWRWRVHVVLWAAGLGAQRSGDFVECGTNRGFALGAILDRLDWGALERRFWCYDTFCGLDARYISEEERAAGKDADFGGYAECYEHVRSHFGEHEGIELVRGAIPETLADGGPSEVAFCHIDLNNAAPERAALEHFWPRLVPGAPVLLDDHAYRGFEPQRVVHEAFAREVGVPLLVLPTGQGVLIKPG